MIAPLAKFIDWSVLQLAGAVIGLKHAPRPKWKLEEALEFLNGPDFIPAASDPARIEFDGPRNFKFPTPRPSEDMKVSVLTFYTTDLDQTTLVSKVRTDTFNERMQIERADKRVEETHRIISRDVVFERLWKQKRLGPIQPGAMVHA